MKRISTFSLLFLFAQILSSQSNKWDVNGNSSNTNDFIGTTNNQALVFKTDNTVRLKISPTGNIIVKDLESAGIGLVKAYDNGKLGKIDLPNDPSYFLDGNGNFSPLVNLVGWSVSGNYVTLDASKKVGIGITNPSLQFEVLGDSKMDGSLRVTDTLKVGDSTVIVAGNGIWTTNGTLVINGSSAATHNTVINPKNSPLTRVGIGAFNPNAKLTLRDQDNNNLSMGRDFLNGNSGIIIKSHLNVTTLPLDAANAQAANLSLAANEFKFYADNNTTADLILKSTGNMGIGSVSPAGRLTIRDGTNTNVTFRKNFLGYGSGMEIQCHDDAGNNFGEIAFNADQFKFTGGRVKIGSGIGTVPGYLLFVEEGILTEKVKVAVCCGTDWQDYVFYDDYKLLSLDSVETYIKENKHLPGIPSAEEMVKTGSDLAKTDGWLLEKVENLFLYTIQLNKDLEALRQENIELKKLIQNEGK